MIAGSAVLVNTVDVQLAFPLFRCHSLAAAFCFIFAYVASNFAAMSSACPYTFNIMLSKTLGLFTPYISSMGVYPVPLTNVLLIHSYDMIYLLTAIGLTPGGSSTVHIYTQTLHRTTQNK